MPTDQIEMRWRCPVAPCRRENKGRHTLCVGCGRPKTAAEAYYLPGDVSPAAAVADPALLRQAQAGPNWSCAFCRSHQRRLDGACVQCGARPVAAPDGTVRTTATPTPAPAILADTYRTAPVAIRVRSRWWAAIGLATGLFLLVVAVLVWILAPRTVRVRTAAHAWTRTVYVERYQINAHEGFAEDEPASAFDVTNRGTRYHHTDQVYDHDETEHYTVSVTCGETCVDVPESCYTTPRSCTDNQNGFATCTGGDEICTGGGQQCSPKYCDEDRTRSVPVFRDEQRYATWYAWRVWEWTPNRTVATTGTAPEAAWPTDDVVHLNAAVAGDERERARYEERYTVTFRDDGGAAYVYEPKTYAEFQGYLPGSPHILRVGPLAGVEIVQ